MSRTFVKSPLRFPGGKSRAVERIIALLPPFREFREPMVGGGSVFFRIRQMYPDRSYWINDLNYELYCFWKMAQSNAAALAKAARQIKENTTDGRKLFYSLLEQYGTGSEFERALRFFILNRITFSGTVDSGGYSEQAFRARFTLSSIRALEKVSEVLQGVRITNLDYAEVIHAPGEDVFLFLDPPYYSVARSRLYGRRGELHVQFDHERFARSVQSCPHRWLITYDDCPEVRRLFRGAYMVEWKLQYGMNNYKQTNARAGKELFIANYDIVSRHAEQLALVFEHRASYTPLE
ncbi:MAG: DNA adenine methylase [Armatimonadota bacterium]